MTASTTATAPATKRKRRPRKSSAVLATCPMNGAGWCPYPFSPAQLQKRLKSLSEKQSENQPEKQKIQN